MVGCHTLISYQKFKSTNYVDILERASPGITRQQESELRSQELPSLRKLIYIDQHEDIAPSHIVRFNDVLNSNHICDDMTKAGNRPKLDSHDVVNIQFTSGTTGVPKAASMSHYNYINNIMFTAKYIVEGLSSKILCVPNPLYHTFGSINGTLNGGLNGLTVVLPSPVPSAGDTLRAIHDYKCSMVFGTPTMFTDIMNHSDIDRYDNRSLERAVMSGAPCPPELVSNLKSKFENLSFVSLPYGATETSPIMTVPKLDIDPQFALKCVGTPLDHTELKLVSTDGSTVPRGQAGEVLTRGHNVMVGYWSQPELTDEVIDVDKWYHTGDLGVMDELDRLSIVGRLKDLIIRGGENIYPREIEDILQSHPSIADVNVVGVADNRLGEEVCACIILKPDAQPLTTNDVKQFLAEKITHFKIPRYVIHLNEFPQTVTMKVQKNELRKIATKKLELVNGSSSQTERSHRARV